MSLLTLPVELQLTIAEALMEDEEEGTPALFKLFRTRRYMHGLLQKEVNTRNLLHAHKLAPAAYTERARKLLAGKAKVNAITPLTGRSVLHHAVRIPNFEVVEMLLKHGANPNAVCSNGRTVLTDAACQGDGAPEVLCQMLLEHGADPNPSIKPSSCIFPLTPLTAAATSGTLATIELLLEAGAKVIVGGTCPTIHEQVSPEIAGLLLKAFKKGQFEKVWVDDDSDGTYLSESEESSDEEMQEETDEDDDDWDDEKENRLWYSSWNTEQAPLLLILDDD